MRHLTSDITGAGRRPVDGIVGRHARERIDMEVAHKDRIEPEDFGLRGDEAQKARYYAEFRVSELHHQFKEALARACVAVEISDSNFEGLCIELDRTLNV